MSVFELAAIVNLKKLVISLRYMAGFQISYTFFKKYSILGLTTFLDLNSILRLMARKIKNGSNRT